MSSSLHALLTGILDYAGLFPPARLPLDQAVRNYARYRREPHHWMLGRFVLPAARLAELASYREELTQPGPPFRIAALGCGGDTPVDFIAGLRADLHAIRAFSEGYCSVAVVDAFEVRIPPAMAGQITELLLGVLNALMLPNLAMASLSFETPVDTDPRTTLPAFLAALYGANRSPPGEIRRPVVGLKLRTGGLEAAAFPSGEQVAFVIAACRDARVRLKFTAGLHHPLPHFDPDVGTRMHGFVNVFAAGVLAHARGLNAGQVQAILEDEDAAHLAFRDDLFCWNDLQATTAEIEAARRDAVTSFGSCSFEEPLADLRSLGWLRE